MDLITQQNAAVAEETASASLELNDQADSIETIINDLCLLVDTKKMQDIKSVSDTGQNENR